MLKRVRRGLSIRKLREFWACFIGSKQWLQIWLSYGLGVKLPESWCFSTRRGIRLRIEDRDELTTVWHVFYSGEYMIQSGVRTIVDLGANIGAFAAWAAERFPEAQIFSVEPFPETFSRLQETVELNRLESRVTCLQLAASGSDGVARFDATAGKRSYCRTLLADSSESPYIEVPTMCLKTLLDRCGLEKLDCLKLDVEGAEYEFLLSTDQQTLCRVGAITMEYHDPSRTKDLWDHLEQCGFRMIHYEAGKWSGLATFQRSSDTLVESFGS